MISDIKDLKRVVVDEILKTGLSIDRVKDTTSGQSVYIYTNLGVVRLSDHHNQKSFEKCLVSITTPVEKDIAEKMIKLLIR